MRRSTLRAIVFLAIGLALAIWVVRRYDVREIWSTASSAGAGALLYAGFHVVPLCLDMFGWRALIPLKLRPSVFELFLIRWTGEAVNNVVPLVVAGDVVRASLVPGSGAATAIDLSVGLVSQAVLATFGVAWIAWVAKVAQPLPAIAATVIAAAAIALCSVALLRTRWFERRLAATLDRPLDKRAIARCALFRTLSGVFGGVEVWIGLAVLDRRTSLPDCIAFFTLATVARSAAFFVPAGFGVQEWSFVALGGVFGVPPETALSLALLRRMREALLGVPGLIVGSILNERSRGRSPPASSLPRRWEMDPKGK